MVDRITTGNQRPPVLIVGPVLHPIGEPFAPPPGDDLLQPEGVGGNHVPDIEIVQLHGWGEAMVDEKAEIRGLGRKDEDY